MNYIVNRYLSPRSAFILLSELTVIVAAALLAAGIRFSFSSEAVLDYDPYFLKTGVLALVYLGVFIYFDLYRADLYFPGRQTLLKIIEATMVATVILFSIFYIVPTLITWRGVLLINTILVPALVLAWRFLLTKNLNAELNDENVLIIGSGELAKKIGFELHQNKGHGLRLVGFIDDDPSKFGQSIVNPGVIGGYGDITNLVRAEGIDRIIVALPDRRTKLPMTALLDCKLHGVAIEEGETFEEKNTGKIPLDQLKPSWMVFSDGFKSLRSRKLLKRVFDFTVSVVLLLLTFPVMLVTAALIKLDSRGPVIFSQDRVGENGRIFKVYKFRSMRVDAEEKTGPVWAKSNDDRVTRVGSVIRKLRIDELPQLINVLKGDMSFVGPRPERPFFVEQLKEVIPYYEMRTVVKPGITGWAQIKYPYGANFDDAVQKLQYDIYYIKNMSPLMDVLIFFMTIKVVLTGRGAR